VTTTRWTTFGAAALASLSAGSAALGQDAPMFRGNLAHTGVYDVPPIQTLTGVKWRFHTSGRVISSPAVAGGVAYVGSTDGHMYAVDMATGTQRWTFTTGSRVTSSPAIDGGGVFFSSYDGNIYRVDAATGKVQWKFATAGERRFAGKHLHGLLPAGETMPDPFDVFLSSPAVSHGTVYVGSGDGNIYAINEQSGQRVWSFHTGNVVHASPAVVDGTVYIGSWDSYFYALDAASGKVKWRFKTGEDSVISNQVGIQSSAAVANGVVYFGCRDSKFYALDAQTGTEKWSFDNKGSWVVSSPAIHEGVVYFVTSDSRMLHALDATTGKPVFSMQMTWFLFGSPAIAGNMLYVGSWDGTLAAVDLKTQKRAWTFESDSAKHNRAALTMPDGSPDFTKIGGGSFYDELPVSITKMFTAGGILSSPVVVPGTIVVGSADGNLYAID
jgi:eukaryotic-like serine/threonine-protein kinase